MALRGGSSRGTHTNRGAGRVLTELRIDVDPGEPVFSVDHVCGLLRRAGKRALWLRQERSGSGKGWHLTLAVSPPCRDLMEVVALQAVLGSDRYREANNVCRVRALDRMDADARAYWSRRLNVFYDGAY